MYVLFVLVIRMYPIASQFLHLVRLTPPSKVSQLKALFKDHGHDSLSKNALEKAELIETAVDFCARTLPDLLADKYDLVANITHESPADVGREGQAGPLQEGSYKCHVKHHGTHQWYEMQDAHVTEIMAQQIGLSESFLLIFERKSARYYYTKRLQE
jgi:hypothetical protein